MGHRKNYRSKKRKFVGNMYSTERATSAASQTDTDVITTASSSKLASNNDSFADVNSPPENSQLSGNRIIDIKFLMTVFASLCCPLCFNCNLVLSEDSRFGLCSNFALKCQKCSFVKGFSSSEKVNTTNKVNTLVVYALRTIGKGFTAGRKLFTLLDLPFFSKATFRRHELKVLHASAEAAQESMNNAAKEVKNITRIQKRQRTLDCGVSMDGTWQKRGYSSLNGCVSCISIDTGKVLDLEILSHYCRLCSKRRSTVCEDHICANHQGSASNMETVGAYRIFERSVTIRNLRYTSYYGDGDSKAFEAVKDIYGVQPVSKLECIGHVQKRVGGRLRKLKKTSKGLGGKGKLTDRFIDKLQNYYGIAIRSNTGDISKMQSAVIAAFYHSCSSSQYPMHGQCPPGADSWCKYQHAKALGETFVEKSPGLPQNIMKIIKPVFLQLCDKKLLMKCLHGKTQNANECFNGVLWNFIPKQSFVELQTLQLGSYIAVLQFNDGAKGVLSVLNKLGVSVGAFTRNGLMLGDFERLNDSKRHSIPEAKIQRKKLRAKRKNKGLQYEGKEGVTYKSGEF